MNSPFGLLEFGSNSLKFYRVELGLHGAYRVATHKFPWRVAHEFFASGSCGAESVEEILSTIRRVSAVHPDIPVASMLSVATGVFREFPAIEDLAAQVKKETGLRLRVISGRDEAKLMARSFKASASGFIMLCDVGGATTEWALMEANRRKACGSLRLGAIRNRYTMREIDDHTEEYLEKSAALCDHHMASMPVTSDANLLVTGGTGRALATIAGTDEVTLAELREVLANVQRDGPPADLKPQRQEVLLAGLIILERLAVRCGSNGIEYAKASVRDGMAARLVKLLSTHRPDDLHSTLLLRKDSQ